MNASGRPNTCKSNGRRAAMPGGSGARVRNAYATYPLQGDNPGKPGLIPHNTGGPHGHIVKVATVADGHASD
jgi:hypothetical protein